MLEIKKIVILVELENGNAHQVLCSKEQKEIALHFLKSDSGTIQLSEAIEPIKFKPLNKQK